MLARYEKWLPMVMMKSLATSIMDCVRMSVRRGPACWWIVHWHPLICLTLKEQKIYCRESLALSWRTAITGSYLAQRLKSYGLHLLAPYKSAKHQKQPYPRYLTHLRYRIETVFGQLVERFHAKRIWARDLWHLTSRWMRKFLSHTLAVYFCAVADIPYLSFAKLVPA